MKTFSYCFIVIIRGYQLFISPLTPPSCRFTPTCSQYGIDCIKKFGIITGTYLTVKRILRCHPFAKGGYDPVPPHAGVNKQKGLKWNKNKMQN